MISTGIFGKSPYLLKACSNRLDAEPVSVKIPETKRTVKLFSGIIVLYREIDEERIAEKKKKRGSGTAKATAKKKVKIKGKRQSQREKEAKNPYAKYDRPKYYGR